MILLEAYFDQVDKETQKKLISVVNNYVDFENSGLDKSEIQTCYEDAIKSFIKNGQDFSPDSIRNAINAAQKRAKKIQKMKTEPAPNSYVEQVDGKTLRKIVSVVNNRVPFKRMGLNNTEIKSCYEEAVKAFVENGNDFTEGWIKLVANAAKNKANEIRQEHGDLPRISEKQLTVYNSYLKKAIQNEVKKQEKDLSDDELTELYNQIKKYSDDFLNEQKRYMKKQEIDSVAEELVKALDSSVIPTEEPEEESSEEKINPLQDVEKEPEGDYNEESFKLWCKFGDNLVELIKNSLNGIGLIEGIDYKLSRGYTESNYIMCPYYKVIAESYKKQLFGRYENSEEMIQKYLEPLLKNNIICLFFLKNEGLTEFRNAFRSIKVLQSDFKISMLDIPQMKNLQYIVYNVMFRNDEIGFNGDGTRDVSEQPLATVCSTIYLGKTRMVFNLKKLKNLATVFLNPRKSNLFK